MIYLDNWEIFVKKRGDFSKQNNMQLSQQTLLGLRMTGLSIIIIIVKLAISPHCSALSLIELVSFVFTIPSWSEVISYSENLPRPLGKFLWISTTKGRMIIPLLPNLRRICRHYE